MKHGRRGNLGFRGGLYLPVANTAGDQSPGIYSLYERSQVTSGAYVVEFVLIAGGGGGQSVRGGGGGAGGVLLGFTYVTEGRNYTITIGAGGSGAAGGVPSSLGTRGNNSVFGPFTSYGGGPGYGQPGGSGGGGGGSNGSAGGSGNVPTLSPTQGNNGGSGINFGAGGGGGFTTSGVNGTANVAGAGGRGLWLYWTGGNERYAGGGGGGHQANLSGTRGLGVDGGGNGGLDGSTVATSGAANSGGGGGGSGGDGVTFFQAGAGGSGVFIVRYPGEQRGAGGTVSANNGYTIHTFTSSGTFTG